MNFISFLETYAFLQQVILVLAVIGLLTVIYLILRCMWSLMCLVHKHDAAPIDMAQNKRIRQLEDEVKRLRQIEADIDNIKKMQSKS